jgi:hypothetical protein
MRNQRSKQVRLAAFGFDERAREGFRLTFRGPGNDRAMLVDEQSADFGIINMDSANAEQMLEEYQRRYPGRPAIKLSVRDATQHDALHVKKPARIADMLEAVDKLIAELEERQREESPQQAAEPQQTASTAPVATPAPAIKPRKKAVKKHQGSLYYNPKDYLQGEIQAAMEYSRSSGLVVELWLMCDENEWKKIVFLPRLRKVITSLSNKELWTYCSSPLTLINHKSYRRNEKETRAIQDRIESDGRGLDYDAFLWKVALYTSQGRLPSGTSLNEVAQLKQWPNLTRLYPIAGSMRIATLLVDQPRPLPMIAKVLKIPPGRVFAFYSAACALGMTGGEMGSFDLARQSMPQRHRDHTLFGRILNRLKKNSEPDTDLYA